MCIFILRFGIPISKCKCIWRYLSSMKVYRRMIGALVCSINMARDTVWIHWHHKGGQQMLWFSIFVCFWISLYTSSQFFKPSVHLLLNSLLFSLLLHICMFAFVCTPYFSSCLSVFVNKNLVLNFYLALVSCISLFSCSNNQIGR